MADFPILILGGTGVFGSRIARLLAERGDLPVMIAGRSLAKAVRLKHEILAKYPAARISAHRVDVFNGLKVFLQDKKAGCVINCVGPYQGQDYFIAEACIASGVHYLDLSDGRDFTAGFDALDGAAKTAGVIALSGASSVPALASSVVNHLSRSMAEVDRIAVGISAGNRAPRGMAVVKAILTYVGKPIATWRDGREGTVYGWQDLQRHDFEVPGAKPLHRRWLSACDTSHLAIFPKKYEGVQTVTFYAGLELSLLHLGLWALSWPVRWGVLPSLAPAAALFKPCADLLLPFGTDRGGMFVQVSGRAEDGVPVSKTWSLIAGSGDGPYIPTLGAIILARKLSRGELARGQAGPAVGKIDLNEFQPYFARFDIRTHID